jgi:signal transduction histidine kinase/CheY-like chemotaxis protein
MLPHIIEEEKRLKCALLSTSLSLFIGFELAVLFHRPWVAGTFSILPLPQAFDCFTVAFTLVDLVLLGYLHLRRNTILCAYCFFCCANLSLWAINALCGSMIEFIISLALVPVLAFYIVGFRAGVVALVVTFAESLLYLVAWSWGLFPLLNDDSLELFQPVKALALSGVFVTLSLLACINERGRVKLLKMYQRSHQELERAAKKKGRYVATLTHELRTPLHGIQAAAQGLLEEVSKHSAESPILEWVETIIESSNHMVALVNNVLDFERLETGQMTLESTPFRVDAEVETVFKVLSPLANKKEIKFCQEIKLGRLCRLGDPLRFRQVLFNLVSNALKFTPSGGSVTISVSDVNSQDTRHAKTACCFSSAGSDGNTVKVEVKDTGIGFKQDPSFLFKSFTQAEASTTRLFGGTGLGLCICKHLCQLMGGNIGVSTKSGEGSNFWFTVPLRPAPDSQQSPSSQLRDSAEIGNRASLCDRKILLVDDNKTNQKMASYMLKKLHCQTVTANNGEECLQMLDTQGPFELILMDCQMPVMDGLEATRRIRESERKKGTKRRMPIIAISASFNPDDMMVWKAAGMDDCLPKPFNVELLDTVIRRWVQQHKESANVQR